MDLADGASRTIQTSASVASADLEQGEAAAADFIPPEVLQALPEPQRVQLMSAITTLLAIGPMPNPIAAKMNTAHITKVLELQEKEMDLEHSDRRDSRVQATLVFLAVLVLGVVVILALALSGHDAILGQLIPIGSALAGGFGGGYAVGRRRS
jgi:hypothetical protein